MKRLFVIVVLLKSATGHALAEKPFDIQCRDFFNKAEKFESEQSTRKLFASERAALQELKLASEYPEFSSDQNAFLKETLQPTSPDTEARLARLNSSELGCDPVRYFVWLRRLIRSSKKYGFNAEDRHQLASHLMTHLRNDAERPRPLLNLKLDLQLLKEADNDSILHLPSEKSRQLNAAMLKLASLEEVEIRTESEFEDVRSTSVDPATSDLEKQRQQRVIQVLQTELNASEQIRSALRGLLDLPPEESGRSVSSSE